MRASLKVEDNSEKIREAVIQIYLFDGYPSALEGLMILKRVLSEKAVPPPAEALDADTLEKWLVRGKAACKAIYRDSFEKLWENVRGLSPDLAQWMIVEGYGKVLSRGGLDLQTREMVNIAILAVKGYPRQLHSHLRGAVNVSVPMEVIDELLRELYFICPGPVENVLKLWREIKLKYN